MNLYHRQYGLPSHPAMVILHGLFGLSDNWDSLAKRFAGGGLHVIVPDQRNHGRSGHSPVHSFEAMADDLLELLEELNPGPVILLGHSMGGKTAMQFALEHPEHITRLIIADISPASGSNSQHHELTDIMLSVPLHTMTSRNQVESYLMERIPIERIRLFLLKNIYWKDKSSLGWRANLEVIQENLAEVFRPIDYPAPFEKPVLFLRGEHSPYISDNDIPRIKELFPQAEIETIKEGSHWLHADNPDGFFDAVMRFVE